MQRLEDINNIREAVSYYHNLYIEKGIQLTNAGQIKPKYEKLADKYYEHDHDIGDKSNDYPIMIEKQERSDWQSKSPTAYILKEEITNALGTTDYIYYIVIFRKKWATRWGSRIENSKYRDSSGIYLPYRVIEYVRNNGMEQQTQLVVIFPDRSYFSTKFTDVMDIFNKIKIPAYVNRWGQIQTGVDKGVFELGKK